MEIKEEINKIMEIKEEVNKIMEIKETNKNKEIQTSHLEEKKVGTNKRKRISKFFFLLFWKACSVT